MKKFHPKKRTMALVVIVAIGVVAALVFAMYAKVRPSWAEKTDANTSFVTVQNETYRGEATEAVSATLVAETKVLVPLAGTLRSNNCAAGTALSSGSAVAVIDDQTILALHTAKPLWRSLQSGDSGDDVVDYQTELSRLGYLTTKPDGKFGTATAKATEKLWKAAGVGQQRDVPIERIVWIPDVSVTPSSCSTSIGSYVEYHDEMLTVGGGIGSLTLVNPPGADAPEKVAYFGDVATIVSADGTITDSEFLAAYVKSPKYQAFLSDSNAGLSINTRFVQPVAVLGVPASAIYNVAGQSACVQTKDGAHTVSILGSQFGSTLIQSDANISSVRVRPATDAPPCS